MTKSVTRQGLYELVPYLYTQEQAEKILAEYPEHERDARGYGVPKLGSGLVFPIDEEKIKCPPFRAPPHFRRLIAVDFGLNHPFAAVGMIWDVESDVIYIARTYKEKDALISTHCAAIKPWGADWIPVAWPHDGHERREVAAQGDKAETGAGFKEVAEMYREQDLNMLPTHATHESGGYEVEPTVTEIFTRMKTKRFKVFSTEEEWFNEFRMYHRKNGQIVKLEDDLMSATRIAVMARRYAIEDSNAWQEIGGDPRDSHVEDRPITGY